MSNTPVHEALPVGKPRRRWRRWLILGTAAAACIAIVLGLYAYLDYAAERDRGEAIAEADRLDPGWRFEDMEAARLAVQDAENSALLVQAAYAKLPANWPPAGLAGAPNIVGRVAQWPVPDRPAMALIVDLRAEMAKAAAALPEARQVADLPVGRHVVIWSDDLIGTFTDHVQHVVRVGEVLALDAVLQALDGDSDGAVRSCRAALNAGRSLGDEPMAISQLVRARCANAAIRALERSLMYTEPSAAALSEIQRLLADEVAAPSLLIAARATRVTYFQSLEQMRTGRFNRATYKMASSLFGERFDTHVDRMRAQESQAAFLRYTTAVVEIARLPTEKQEERLRALAVPTQQLPPLLDGLTKNTDWVRFARRFHCTQAMLRCAEAAVAAERYRLDEHRWPGDLNALVPRYFAAVPADPFDGRPLRMRRMPDEILIYSVGPDRVDNGGKLDRQNAEAANTDIGFQLWDTDRRGFAAR